MGGEPGSEGHRGRALGGEEGGRHAQAPSPRGVQSCQEPQVLGAQLQATDLGGHAAGASMSLEMWMLSPNYTFLRYCPPWKIIGHFMMFSRAIPSPLCQGGHCHPPGTPVIHSQAQRAVCTAPGRLTPDPALWGITTCAPHTIVCLQHGADLSPCEVSQEKSEIHRASCPTLSREHQAEPKGSNVLLIPLAPPIVPETGTHTQTLSQTHTYTHKHTNKI